jgi:hypothetical protein
MMEGGEKKTFSTLYINFKKKNLNMVYTYTTQIIIQGDININYFVDSTQKQLLDSLSTSYCLCSTIQFSTKIQNKSHAAIDHICMNMFKFNNFTLYTTINGLSDNDAQYIIW